MEAASDMEKPCSPAEVRDRLDRTENGGVKNSIKNCLTVFRLDEVLYKSIRYNLFTEKIEIVRQLWWHKRSPVLNETDVNYLMLYLEETYGLSVETKIARAISIIADKNKYHPIQEKLKSLVWDGVKRIENALPHFLGVEKNEYTCAAMQLFMLGAIHRAFQPGCKFEMMLCLVGGQGAGKSTFFRFLAIKDEWFTDDLKKLDDDNVFRKMQGHWIVEMSEMIATANAKSIEDIKSFLSRQKETYKVPYDKQPDDRLRQCVFGGTSNKKKFLPFDRTGNRRFVPVQTDRSQMEVHILANETSCFLDSKCNSSSCLNKPSISILNPFGVTSISK